jgi:tetratricopeptide (TPR) repeat protein
MQISDAPRKVSSQVVFALLAALTFWLSPACADDLQEASKLLKAGQHQQAMDRVNKVLASKPRDPQARFLKGLIYTEQGNTREAIEIFTKLTQDYPELPEPYNNLAVIYASQGQYEKARTSLEQSIHTHPSYATAYENLGDVYAKLASQAYDKALQLDSSNSGAQNKLSLVRELVGGPQQVAVVSSPQSAKSASSEAAKPAPAVTQKETPPPAPAKPAAEKTAPALQKPVPAKPAAPASPAEVLAAVNGWARAWSKKDADAYIAYYAKEFKIQGGESRAEWEKGRRSRIAAPKSISVSIASPKVTMAPNGEAKVTFRQTYRSDVLKSHGTKTLIMMKSDGRWQILQERSGG